MADDKRIEEEKANADVEAHGAKEIAGIGLAAAALIGAGAAGVKMATDDDGDQRNVGALLSPEARFAEADRDRDGYLTYGELTQGPFGKLGVEELKAEGIEVTAEALAAAGVKVELALIGKEGGFAVEGETIMLRRGVDSKVDELVKGPASEWAMKFKEIDRDGDGYAGYEELLEAGWRWNVDELREAGYDVTPEGLAKAGFKQRLETFGEGGFVMKGDMIMPRLGVDRGLDVCCNKAG